MRKEINCYEMKNGFHFLFETVKTVLPEMFRKMVCVPIYQPIY